MSGMTAFNGSLAYSMCCLVRDLNNYVASTWMPLLKLTIVAASNSILTSRKNFRAASPTALTIRTSGHLHVGCDVDSLLFFLGRPYLLHTMLDYVYLIWLSLHLGEAFTVAGTITMWNNPPSKDTSLNDTLGLH
jgi:tyrosinase